MLLQDVSTFDWAAQFVSGANITKYISVSYLPLPQGQGRRQAHEKAKAYNLIRSMRIAHPVRSCAD